MPRRYKAVLLILIIAGLLAAGAFYLHGHANMQVLNTKGTVGDQERRLIYIALSLSLLVVIPVFALLFAFAWRYREGNRKAAYSPDLDHSRTAETIWWLIPSVLILILSVITWNSSHQLDPYKALSSNAKPLNVQVVALDWKWLFIYPDQHIASLNMMQFPVNTPVNFAITSDSVMNSFWIPQLGGQIYAMPGMVTQLHLMANQAGSYAGSSANISGAGFAGMTFTARASSQTDFNDWVQTVKESSKTLDADTYAALAQPSKNNPVAYYASADSKLYDTITMKYMMPMGGDNNSMSMRPSMNMQSMDMQNMNMGMQ